MLFVDLDKLKITKNYNFLTESRVIGDSQLLQGTLAQVKDAVKIASQEMLATKPAIECVYNFVIEGEGEASEDEAADFLVVVNAIIGSFFSVLVKSEARERQYRLDVPARLKGLKINYGTLKKAVNNQTMTDVFNLTVEYKDLKYVLVDEKFVESNEAATDQVEASHEED